MTALRTYEQELAAVRAVLEPRRVEARKWARPELWDGLRLMAVPGDMYCVYGSLTEFGNGVFVEGRRPSRCFICGASWQETPCEHQLGLASMWVGGHPIPGSRNFIRNLARELEGGAR